MMNTTRTLTAIAAVLSMALAGTAQAQKSGAQAQTGDQADALLSQAVRTETPPPVNDGEAYHRADDAEQDPAELRTTQALNDEIASRNQLAENQERADQAAFEAERAKYEATVTQSTQAQLAYEEDVRRSSAAQTQWQADQERWAAERARWEADVRACNAGDRTRCAAPRN